MDFSALCRSYYRFKPRLKHSSISPNDRLALILDPDLDRLRDSYLRIADPTEYRFALKEFGSWDAWEKFSENPAYNTIIASWRRELDVKIRSDALVSIMEVALGTTRDSLQANKYLYEKSNVHKERVGRPSKEKISREAKQLLDIELLRVEDHKRVMEHINK